MNMSIGELLIVAFYLLWVVGFPSLLARWASRGTGKKRVIIGALASWILCTIIGLGVFVVASVVFRPKVDRTEKLW